LSSSALFQKKYIPVCLLLIITLSVFYPVLSGRMISLDDKKLIMGLNNPDKSISIKEMFFRPRVNRYYRPLLTLTFILDREVWHFETSGYHLTNYILHTLNMLLFFLIARRFFTMKIQPERAKDESRIFMLRGGCDFSIQPCWFRDQSNYLPFVCALLFSLHPLTCESVAWISGRSDLLAAFFSLLTFNFYMSKIRGKEILTALSLLAGLLSKESALAVIPIILTTEFARAYKPAWLDLNFCPQPLQQSIKIARQKTSPSSFLNKENRLRSAFKAAFKWGLVLTAPLIVYLYLRMPVLTHLDHGMKTAITSGLAKDIATGWDWNRPIFYVPATITFYIKKLFIPFPLNFAIHKINVPLYFSLFGLTASLNIFFIIKKKYAPALWLALVITAFLPAVFVAFSRMAWTPFAERYLYLAVPVWSLGIGMFFQWIYAIWPSRANRLTALVFSVLLIFSITTFSRTLIWKSNLSLWEDTYRKSPDSGKVLYKYGAALGGEKGLVYFTKAVALSRDDEWKDMSLLALAHQALKDKQYQTAARYADQAIKINPGLENHTRAVDIIRAIPCSPPTDCVPKTKKLIMYFEKIYSKSHNPWALFQIAQLYAKAGNLAKSRSFTNKLIDKFPSSRYAETVLKSDNPFSIKKEREIKKFEEHHKNSASDRQS